MSDILLTAAKMRDASDAELRAAVEEVVARHNVDNLDLSITVTPSDDDIRVQITSTSQNTFMRVKDNGEVDVSVDAAASRAKLTPINLALVVDTTESMGGDNISALKAAVKGMVEQLDTPGNKTRMSLVPFGQYVNVGIDQGKPGSRTWIDMGEDYGKTHEHCYRPSIQIEAPVCQTVGTITYEDIRDGRNFGTKTRDDVQCEGGKYEQGEETCTTITRDWHGCMGSRKGGLGEQPAAGGKRIPAALDIWCGSPVVPMTKDLSRIGTAADSLTVRGKTYMPSGLLWGWRTLEPSLPYSEASAFQKKGTKEALVIMTDGYNTRARGTNDDKQDHLHENTTDISDADKVTAKMCEKIKKEDIELFVVAYRFPGSDSAQALLEACATSPSHFFEPDNAAELASDFLEVASMLDNTRLIY